MAFDVVETRPDARTLRVLDISTNITLGVVSLLDLIVFICDSYVVFLPYNFANSTNPLG